MARKGKTLYVKVAPFTYKIMFDSSVLALRDNTLWGTVDFESQLIIIRHDLALESEKETVTHELGHVVNQIAGITDDTIKNYDEEHIVRVTSPLWFQLIIDSKNQKFFEYLRG